MFGRASISDYYRYIKKEIKEKVESEPDDYILSVDEQGYAKHLFDSYALFPIEEDSKRKISAEQVKERREVRDAFGDLAEREVASIRLEYPIVPKPRVKEVLELMSSTYSLTLPKWEYDEGEAMIVIHTPVEPSKTQREIEGLKQFIQRKNDDIAKENPQLRADILKMIKQRKEKVSTDKKAFEEAIKRVEIPLVRKDPTQTPIIDFGIKQSLKPLMPPKAKPKEEYVLDRGKVLSIIEIVDNQGKGFEIAPNVYSKLEEEELRSIILSTLNSIFEGRATGETFSKKGKTDIYLNIAKGCILIMECKYWKGETGYQKAIDQLFKYLTWRQNYGILISFSRNKSFTEVLQQAAECIKNHSTYRRGFTEIGTTHFESHHVFPDDESKTVEIHHLFFNLYTS